MSHSYKFYNLNIDRSHKLPYDVFLFFDKFIGSKTTKAVEPIPNHANVPTTKLFSNLAQNGHQKL